MHRPVVRNPTNRLNLQRSRPHRLLAHGSGTLLSVQGSQHRVRADVSGSSSSSHFARSLHRMASPSIRDRARNRKPDRTAATSSESDRAAIDRARPRCFVTYRDFPRHTVHLGGRLSGSRDEARRPSLCNPALLSDVHPASLARHRVCEPSHQELRIPLQSSRASGQIQTGLSRGQERDRSSTSTGNAISGRSPWAPAPHELGRPERMQRPMAPRRIGAATRPQPVHERVEHLRSLPFQLGTGRDPRGSSATDRSRGS